MKLTEEQKRVIKYFIVGGWNTLFGIGFYTFLIMFFGQKHYLLLSILGNIVSITQAYICYKIFVFKTKGNVVKEYLRCYAVYGIGFLSSVGLLYTAVDIMKYDAIISNIVITLLIAVISYLGHKYFTFKISVKK